MEVILAIAFEAIEAGLGRENSADDPEDDGWENEGHCKGHHAAIPSHSQERKLGYEHKPQHHHRHPWRDFTKEATEASWAYFEDKADVVSVAAVLTMIGQADGPLWGE